MIVNLIIASLALTNRAIGKMQAVGLGETLEAAQMMKDLGKTHSFAATLPHRALQEFHRGRGDASGYLESQEWNHQDREQEWLERSLALQEQLQGSKHKNTANVLRLLGRDTLVAPPRPSGEGDSDRSEETEDLERLAEALE